MLIIAAIVLFYVTASYFAVRFLINKCSVTNSYNLRLLAKSLCYALFFTPTVSIPGSLPVPALAMLFVGVAGLFQFHGQLVLAAILVGVLPISVVMLVLFSFVKMSHILRGTSQ